MVFEKQTFMDLKQTKKSGKPKFLGYSDLCLQQNSNSYAVIYEFKSPILEKRRYITLISFKYDDIINKKSLNNILTKLTIFRGFVAQGLDPLENKKAIKEQNRKNKIITVHDIFEKYIASKHFLELAINTQKSYKSNYKNHIRNKWKNHDITKIKRNKFKYFFDNLRTKSISNLFLIVFQQIENYAIDLEVIAIPFTFKIKQKPIGERKKVLNDIEIQSIFFTQNSEVSLRNISRAQLLHNLRYGEISGLKWSEINYKENTFTISHKRIKTQHDHKEQNTDYVLPLMPKMLEILDEQKKYKNPENQDLVFPRIRKTKHYLQPFSSTQSTYWLEKNLNIENGTHQLRKTCSTRLIEIDSIDGYDIKLILNHAKILGGSTDIYIQTQNIKRKRRILTTWHDEIDRILCSDVTNITTNN